ncbi:Gp49 family protein [Metapseudomonas otitidis]|uniref:Gp49 family protein n=1 Tax=Metapseudomonas otitidis TaxID=319939 RepID=UPI0013F5CEDC|nr:Gp49 family protein [Pseudomonas otitidis]
MTPSEQDKALEAQILAKGLTAPRVLPEQIDDLVDQLSFHTYVIPGTTVTVAAAIAPGNIVVALGKSGAASAANFDEMVGRNRAISRAKDAARGQLWELEGYRLKRNLLDLQEFGGLDQVLEVAASMPPDLADVWAASAVPFVAIHQAAPCARCQGQCQPVVAVGLDPTESICSCSSCKAPKAETKPSAGV